MRHLIFVLLLLSHFSFYGQILHDADRVLPVKYARNVGFDSIFVVFGPGVSGFSDTLSMTAISPYGQGSTIEWYRVTNVDDVLSTELLRAHVDTTQLGYQTIVPGAYLVKFVKDGQDTTLLRWAYFNDILVDLRYEESCTDLFLEGIEGGNSFNYFNPDTLYKTYQVRNGLDADWLDYYFNENSQRWVVLDSIEFSPEQTNQYLYRPPMEYKTYMFRVNVKDSLGHNSSDSIVYQSIAVIADFAASQRDEEISPDSLMFEAPLLLGFKNKSVNAEMYQWIFYNDSARIKKGEPEVLRTSEFYQPIDSVLFKYPGSYDVKLRVKGRIFVQNGVEKTCVDSVRKKLFVKVYNSFLGELPTFMTPGEDGNNDVFYFRDIEDWDYLDMDAPLNTPTTSIQKFEVFIYNRYGLRVYKYEGPDWSKSNAWDGKYNGKYVGSGVYYYVIRARGYDGRKFDQKGFFHVFKSNK